MKIWCTASEGRKGQGFLGPGSLPRKTQSEHPCAAAEERKGTDRNDDIALEQGLCQDKDRIW